MGVTPTLTLMMEGLGVIGAGGMLTGKGPLGSLKPRMPAAPAVQQMPDQNQLLQSQQLQASKDAAMRYGRAATVLSTNSSTGDKLGP